MTDTTGGIGREFARMVAEIASEVIKPSIPAFEIAVVTSIDDNRARIRRLPETVEEAREFSVLASLFNPQVGDTVLCARHSGTLIILGRVGAASPLGQTIATIPVYAVGTSGGLVSFTNTGSYTEIEAGGRRNIPFGQLPIKSLRLSYTVGTGATTTKGIRITDIADVTLLTHEWTIANPVAQVSPWVDVAGLYDTDQVVKIKCLDNNTNVFNFHELSIQALVQL